MYLEMKLKQVIIAWRVLNLRFPKNWKKKSVQTQTGKWEGYRLV